MRYIDNNFHFICTTWIVGGERAIWLDGIKRSYLSNTLQFTPSSTFEIGYKSWSASYYSGSIYNVSSYNRVLTENEVLQNYNALAPRYGLTANTSGNTLQRTLSNTVLAAQFDEVTFNPALPTTAVKNLLSYSQQFTNSVWSTALYDVTTTATSATTAPDGTYTAYKLVAPAAGPYYWTMSQSRKFIMVASSTSPRATTKSVGPGKLLKNLQKACWRRTNASKRRLQMAANITLKPAKMPQKLVWHQPKTK